MSFVNRKTEKKIYRIDAHKPEEYYQKNEATDKRTDEYFEQNSSFATKNLVLILIHIKRLF